ncbi:MAG: gliding motility protein GldL [Bacteroidales bacterium]|nr:gliding motility protein GldL [Bacteroidales bacterium]MBD5288813.1 gliding motility protein GldL [Bacteroides sp.]MDE6255979.1 gliding motility protein GldL [Muribaculaceae bacterium]
MVKIRKYANGIERFLHGQKGQRFFNFCYSIGAAIVIWGALFKILHLEGGSTLLCIGMGTEIAMFILTAFDRPPKEYAWEEVFPVLESKDEADRPDFTSGSGVVINGGGYAGYDTATEAGMEQSVPVMPAAQGMPMTGVMPGIPLTQNPEEVASMADATSSYLSKMQEMSDQMSRLNETTEALNRVCETLLGSYQAITQNSETISGASNGYVDQMQDLNRNIAGLNTIYEIQLKSVASQLESIDRVNRGLKDIRDMYEKSAAESSRYCEETERMARYMKQLNSVYEKMITAMTINMANPMMGGANAAAGGINPFDESLRNND